MHRGRRLFGSVSRNQRAQREKLGCKGQEAAETINRHKAKRKHRVKDEVMVSSGQKWYREASAAELGFES